MSDPAPPPTPGRDKIGVIVACHNQGRHVGEALASRDRQTHGNWEAVLVDDASTDSESAGFCAKQSSGKVRVFLEKKNRGRASVRRFALQFLASCEYLFVLDADDFLAPDYLAKVLGGMRANPRAGMAYGTLHFFSDSDPRRQITRCWPTHAFRPERAVLEENIPGPGTLFRRELLDGLDPWRKEFNLTSAEDEDLALQVFEAGRDLVWVPEATYFYRQHGESFLASAPGYLRVLAKVRILRRHRQLVETHGGCAMFLDRWIGPALVGMIHSGQWREAAAIIGELLPAAPAATLAWLSRYYFSRLRARIFPCP